MERVWQSNLDLTFFQHLVLGPEVSPLPKPAGETGDAVALGVLAARLYAVFDRTIYSYDGASWSGALHTVSGLFNDLSNIDLEGMEYLVMAHSGGVDYSSDGQAWASVGE